MRPPESHRATEAARFGGEIKGEIRASSGGEIGRRRQARAQEREWEREREWKREREGGGEREGEGEKVFGEGARLPTLTTS
jgi:hypothetical protein